MVKFIPKCFIVFDVTVFFYFFSFSGSGYYVEMQLIFVHPEILLVY